MLLGAVILSLFSAYCSACFFKFFIYLICRSIVLSTSWIPDQSLAKTLSALLIVEILATVVQLWRNSWNIKQTVIAEPSKYIGRKCLVNFLSASFRLSAFENQPMGTFSHSCEVEIGALSHANQHANLIVQKYFTIRVKHFSKIYNQQTVRKNASSDRNVLSKLVIFKHQ